MIDRNQGFAADLLVPKRRIAQSSKIRLAVGYQIPSILDSPSLKSYTTHREAKGMSDLVLVEVNL